MGEMEAAPLWRRERTECEVGETARGAEGLVGLTEDDIEMGEGFVSAGDELLAWESVISSGWCDFRRSLAAARHESQGNDDELSSAMW